MTRNKYTEEFEQFVRNNASENGLDELLKLCEQNFDYNLTKKNFCRYLSRHKIRHRDFNPNLAHPALYPVGAEWVRDDGMTLIKVEQPSKWMYKQRYIYEQHYGKLSNEYKVIFLDQNRNNFDIDNLMAVPKLDSLIAFNKGLLSSNPEVTKTGIMVAHLINKTKKQQNKTAT